MVGSATGIEPRTPSFATWSSAMAGIARIRASEHSLFG